jgi:phosphatidylethanolamine/phosphatidyl-N-methylethanolamine N-methyltransferase
MDATFVGDRIQFLRMFLAEPNAVGAIAPSSSSLAAEIVRQAGVARSETIVELGGGTGSFTKAITDVAPREAMIISIEINPTFARLLSSRFGGVHVITDSAERIGHYLLAAARTSADCVVSGLPWAAFDDDLQSRLLAAISRVLVAGGIFATFAYVHASWLPAARRFRDRLHETFATVETTPIIWRNLPPAFVYRCVL